MKFDTSSLSANYFMAIGGHNKLNTFGRNYVKVIKVNKVEKVNKCCRCVVMCSTVLLISNNVE